MSALNIKTYPTEVLRLSCAPVERLSSRERDLLSEMFLIMRRAQGIGLAAPQVGVSQRLIVADIGQGPLKLANPKIISIEGRDVMEEGCLSVPNATVKVARPYQVVVQGINEQGKVIKLKAKGLLARVLLHEIDHLNGRLIIDYMNLFSKIKYNIWLKKS